LVAVLYLTSFPTRRSSDLPGSRKVVGPPQWALQEFSVDRVGTFLVADQDRRGHQPKTRMGVKGIGGPFQGARCPPGVVVAERHIGRVRVRHTGVTGRAADVSSQTHQSDIGK